VEIRRAQQTQRLSDYSRPQLLELKMNKFFPITEHSYSSKPIERKMIFTLQGDAFYHAGQYEKSLECYDREIDVIREEAYANGKQGIDSKALAIAYGRRGRAFYSLRKYDHAILSFDCQRILGLEIEDPKELAESYFGMGDGYYQVGEAETIR